MFKILSPYINQIMIQCIAKHFAITLLHYLVASMLRKKAMIIVQTLHFSEMLLSIIVQYLFIGYVEFLGLVRTRVRKMELDITLPLLCNCPVNHINFLAKLRHHIST